MIKIILDNKTTSKDTSITRIKNDIANGKCENGSATTYLNGKNATQETAYYLYWVWDYNEESDEWKFGDKRITKTEIDTRTYIDTFLYGDSETNTLEYDNFF